MYIPSVQYIVGDLKKYFLFYLVDSKYSCIIALGFIAKRVLKRIFMLGYPSAQAEGFFLPLFFGGFFSL